MAANELRTGSEPPLPGSHRADEAVAGHWLLARLGKRVLRPGGVELTRTLLSHAQLTGADVVELAPGLGRTATEIVARAPRSYVGAEADPDAANVVRGVLGDLGAHNATVRVADAADTGLPDASGDVVIGEAMLTMQGDAAKRAIVAEAARVLRPGGRYAIHELALTPDTVSEEVSTDIRRALARAIKVNARPLTVAEWSALLAEHGLVVDHVATAPMALLQPRRLVSDEGLFGALRFARNVLVHRDARKRVLTMRRTFRKHRRQLAAVAIVAHKPTASQTG
ncbi:methyltransferase domain-containing protein [Mycobacterium avium subsp. hominissuis]|uniref:class I SAM-dependent methyltransferase n=1 Tax=Mycobacterium avium TaxID=1764 RepID=UPI0009FDBD60|nr:class I SAM-dependent methyltransferase [Mycobacterium avium]MBZ4558546.1 methyltransferase domain-containing protein [Mycobacterium avium subsp. hominissuis]MBZ4570734.1 methyltransferase domain-containing protein [Mycobacterium avium subsp. hominissuis]MBZ4589482.1 methyltransferase domain-containing protein [Mycobacterium avium subsp. hominissuis]MBZ4627620.1 methyltransferase domain-containing protein [Mycobacterium avium subsp. hominissuis]